jgi:Flp pilus assembly protein TadG
MMKIQTRTTNQSERGQAIVLVALALVGLLGFTALAVDGGTIFFERRRAQSAADASAIAAAFASVDYRNYLQAGMEQALANGFDNNGTTNTVVINNPPVSGPYTGEELYFQVFITTVTTPIFSQVIFGGELENEVEATARAVPNTTVSVGNAIHATSPDECKAMWFSGNFDSVVTGGHIFSNSDADGSSGGSSCQSGIQDGNSGHVQVNGAGIKTVGGWSQHDAGTVTADEGVQTGVDSQPLPPVPTPDCTGLPTRSYGGGDETLEPGFYPDRIHVTNQDVVLSPGLYCIDDDVIFTGGSITGVGVTLYIISGDYHLSGNADVNLTAPTDLTDASGNQWAGMLVYMDPSNSGTVELSGNTGSRYNGTIYAPDPASPSSKAKCTITGNADFVLNSQVICYSVKVTGNSDVTINYDAANNFHMPPLIELVQ